MLARTHCRIPLNLCSAYRRGCHLHNTQEAQQTKTRTLSGIRTRSPSNKVAADTRLRLHGHRDWQINDELSGTHLMIREYDRSQNTRVLAGKM